MKYQFFLVIALFFPFQGFSSAPNYTWSDSVCDTQSKTFEGATRDFYNRGAFLRWENKLGDWKDSAGIKQGNSPFAQLNKGSENTALSADVTNLVQQWANKTLLNHGFYLKQAKGQKVLVGSRENTNYGLHPKLLVTTRIGTTALTPSKDTSLNKGTFRCEGQKVALNLKQPTLIAFDLSELRGNVLRAELQLTSIKPVKKLPQVEIYSVRIDASETQLDSVKASGDYKDIFFHTGFEDNSWKKHWKFRPKGKFELTTKNHGNGFMPINGKALSITIRKGQNVGIGAALKLDNFVEFIDKGGNEAYLQYFVRFGSNWHNIDVGKLPGFAGIYSNETYRAGWGGRRSDGSNGWSARARFSKIIEAPNPLADHLAIGTYLYHSEQTSRYGDHFFWVQSDNNVLPKNKWIRIEQRVKLNDKGKSNGILQSWVNGHLAFDKRDVNFSNNPNVGIEEVWLTAYHGGKKAAVSDIELFIDELSVSNRYIGTAIIGEVNEKPH